MLGHTPHFAGHPDRHAAEMSLVRLVFGRVLSLGGQEPFEVPEIGNSGPEMRPEVSLWLLGPVAPSFEHHLEKHLADHSQGGVVPGVGDVDQERLAEDGEVPPPVRIDLRGWRYGWRVVVGKRRRGRGRACFMRQAHHDTPPRKKSSSASRRSVCSPIFRATSAPTSARRRSYSLSSGRAAPVHSWSAPWTWRRSATAARSSAGNSPSEWLGQWPQKSRTISWRRMPKLRRVAFARGSAKYSKNVSRKAG